MKDSEPIWKVASFVMAVTVLSAVIIGGISYSSQPARADIGEQGTCIDDLALAGIGVIAGATGVGVTIAGSTVGAVGISNADDPCWTDEVQDRLDTINSTYDNQTIDGLMASATLSNAHMNDKWEAIDRWDYQTTYRMSFHGKLAFLESYYDNSSEAQAVDDAYGGLDEYHASREAEYVAWWNSEMADIAKMEAMEPDGYDIIKVGVVSGNSITWYDDEYTIEDLNVSEANVEMYELADGTQVEVYPFYNTSDHSDTLSFVGGNEVVAKAVDSRTADEQIVLGEDAIQSAADEGVGAAAYTPTINPSDADVVVDINGSGSYTTILGGLQAAPAGGTVYVMPGTYAEGQIRIDDSIASNVTLVADDATLTSDSADHTTLRWDGDSNNGITLEGLRIEQGQAEDFALAYMRNNASLNHVTVVGIVQDFYPNERTINNSFGTSDAFETNAENSIASPTHVGRFNSHFDDLDNASSTVANRFGDETTDSKYLHRTYSGLDDGFLHASDVMTRTELAQMGSDEDFVGSQAWVDLMMSAGPVPTHSFNNSVVIEVYANDTSINGVPVTETQELEAHIYPMQAPASGGWQVNTTYNSSDLGGPVTVTYLATKERYSGGEWEVYEELETADLEGPFKVVNIINSDTGEEQDTAPVSEPDDADYDNPNEDLLATIQKYIDQQEEHDEALTCLLNEDCDYDGEENSAGTPDGATCDINIPVIGSLLCSGISSATFPLAAIVFLAAAVYLFAPELLGLGKDVTVNLNQRRKRK